MKNQLCLENERLVETIKALSVLNVCYEASLEPKRALNVLEASNVTQEWKTFAKEARTLMVENAFGYNQALVAYSKKHNGIYFDQAAHVLLESNVQIRDVLRYYLTLSDVELMKKDLR